MGKKKKTVTTIEAHQFFVIHKRQNPVAASCPQCPVGQSVMVTPDEAATLAGASPRAIYRVIESGAVHFSETADGALFVCLRSLAEVAGRDHSLT